MQLLRDRLVEGFILVATPLEEPPGVPSVAIAGHELPRPGDKCGDRSRSRRDPRAVPSRRTRPRTDRILQGSREQRRHRDPLAGDPHGRRRTWASRFGPSSPCSSAAVPPSDAASRARGLRGGTRARQQLLQAGSPFSALFAFNDVSAIGAMRAFLDAGMRGPAADLGRRLRRHPRRRLPEPEPHHRAPAARLHGRHGGQDPARATLGQRLRLRGARHHAAGADRPRAPPDRRRSDRSAVSWQAKIPISMSSRSIRLCPLPLIGLVLFLLRLASGHRGRAPSRPHRRADAVACGRQAGARAERGPDRRELVPHGAAGGLASGRGTGSRGGQT